MRYSKIRTLLLAGCAGVALSPAFALAQTQPQPRVSYDIPAQDLGAALTQFGQQSEREIVFSADLARNKKARAVAGEMTSTEALAMLLSDTGLTYRTSSNGSIIVEASDPQSGSAAGDGADGTVAALVVTAQKREEQIQDVPIAISAFTEKSLDAQKIETGGDLLKAIPNVTFSKNNFSSYNFAIRGIGTKAISVATDPGVAVEFNSTALIRNRLFEQEYFDIERVEVLRGPQGTLHGRNATAGAINVISAKPTGEWAAQIKTEIGNYSTRRMSGFVNAPIAGDKLAVRIAGAWTARDGYDYNAITQHPVNGRDLYSVRATVGFHPTEKLHGVLIWEHFNENDNRSRTGKQLCHRDPGPTNVNGVEIDPNNALERAQMSQGCSDGSLYNQGAFGTPNGLAIPFMLAASEAYNQSSGNGYGTIGFIPQPGGSLLWIPLVNGDPYGGLTQSSDLHTIASIKDPIYRARADIFELNFDYELTPSLTFTSQTAYDRDQYYSTQDYNRFNTVPVFNSTDGLFGYAGLPAVPVTSGGVFCDPQIGCSKSIAGFDISQARSRQFSQEFRLQSSFSGPINFSVGANYTRYRTVEDYYVLFNVITALAELDTDIGNVSADPTQCARRFNTSNPVPPTPIGEPGTEGCIYIDPNPLDKINGEGHNYYRSKNPYKLNSKAVFGEIYWQATPEIKLTAGLRYNDDRKTATPVPTQVLLSSRAQLAGTVDRGYPSLPDIKQHWGEVTGRLGVDWKPDLAFTDQTMVYAFYSRGYKGGGANPPGIGFNPALVKDLLGMDFDCGANPTSVYCRPFAATLPYPKTFRPEFVNAFEVGSKNTLLGGSLVLNGDVFFYDYTDYQISQIKSRTAVNENFDAKVWGAELESVWQPTPQLRFNLALGYQDSALGNGSKSIDLMNRTQGNPDYTIFKPFVQLPDNCVVLKSAITQPVFGGPPLIDNPTLAQELVCPGSLFHNFLGPLFGLPETETIYPNGGLGFYADLSGHKLPNAPHWTQSIGAQYTMTLSDEWQATLRADFYHQSQSWARVYEDAIDKLHGWKNANVVLTVSNPDTGLSIEVYAKNVFNDNAITDTFLNSDDTALTTNIFTLDPRLIGLNIKKSF